jgi:hypothetical protein
MRNRGETMNEEWGTMKLEVNDGQIVPAANVTKGA